MISRQWNWFCTLVFWELPTKYEDDAEVLHKNHHIRIPVAHHIPVFLRPTSVFSNDTVSHPNTSSSKDISDVKLEGLNPLKSASSTLENLSTIHIYNLHSKWNHSDCLFYWRGKYKRSEDKSGCLFPHCHDVLWGERGKLQWIFNSRGKFILEHRRTTKTTLSKVVWQIILPSAKRKSNPYK